MKKLMLFLLVLCTGSYALAQRTVNGTVTSSADGLTMPGVSIVVKGTATGTATDIDGNFSLTIPSDRAVLVFTYIGYQKKEISVTGSSRNLQVILDEDSYMLDEVTISVQVGYGAMKRSDLTGAVGSIGANDIRKSMSTSLEQAMQGRIAGVQITQNTGAPGGGISVNIRGINTLSGNEPLYVIDGVAVSGQSSGGSVLSTINPADIVSIEVLKDASATAIYGSRASNGVVMITTRQGEIGKPRLSYDGYFGLQQLPTKLEVMNLKDYAQFYNDRASIQGWGSRDEFNDISLLTNGTDWQKELFRTAPMNNHTLSVSGGSPGVKYMLSGGYLDQDGIGMGSGFRRFTFRSNMDMEITKWLNIGVNGSVANTKQITTLDGNSIIREAISQRVDVPAVNPDGSFGVIKEDQFNTYYVNPLAAAQMRENYNTGTQLTYSFYADLKLLPDLNLRSEYGGNMNYSNQYSFTPNYKFGNQQWTSQARKQSGKSDYYAVKTYATYDKKFADKHKLNIMAGHEAQESNWENLWGLRTQYISNSIHSLNVGNEATAQNGDGQGGWSIESYYGRLNYNFDDRYLATATFRADGSSTFGQNNRWGNFPSAALAWRASNESFLKDVEAINNLKFRLGWGIVGNQAAGMYAYGVAMATTGTYWGTGYLPQNYANPDLQWEQTEAFNIGLDLTVLNNRIELMVDAYNKNTDNLLMQATLPTYAVYVESWMSISPPWVNTGAMNNKGMEFTLNTTNIDTKDFFWKTGLIFSFNKNKLTKLYSEGDQLFGAIGDNVYTKSEVGQPLGQLFGYNVIGMFTCEDDFYQKDAFGEFRLDEEGNRMEVARPGENGNPYAIDRAEIWVGDYIFEDVNGDGVIDEKDRIYLGKTSPKFLYGINNTFSWKNFELNVFFNGVYGNKVYNVLRQSHASTNGYGGKMQEVAGYARVALIDPAGENVISNVHVTNAATATASRVYGNGDNRNNNERISSRFVEDGSYLRLKNISLTYTVPKPWLRKKLPVDYLQIYVNAQNLFTITKYKGFDPEIGSYDARLAGIDNARYPSQRIYNFGLRFNF